MSTDFKNSEFLTPDINSRIAQSEIDGGVWLKDLPVGSKIEFETENTLYLLEHRGDGFYISGNQRFCPTPTKCNIHGSTWGGSMLKMKFIGRGMNCEFTLDGSTRTLTTTRVAEIRQVA